MPACVTSSAGKRRYEAHQSVIASDDVAKGSDRSATQSVGIHVRHEIATSLSLLAMTGCFDSFASAQDINSSRRWAFSFSRDDGLRRREKLPQHVRQDPAVLIVIDLDRRIDP